ncbi:MAG: enolase C-terminal domain-like protein [Planctomycetaceae bacterium]|jgi:L-alanine-DL-glutamate epimerase-like enolase superfamily enzyme|nr:enolase C-terminal domain-like protein [Planctomycetaceae bacterium]
MTKSTDIRIVDVACTFEAVAFRTPLKFGGRITENSTLINVEIGVENGRGVHAAGYGSMPLGNIWAWPSATVSPDQAEAAMQEFAERVAALVDSYPEFGHPMDIMFQLSAEYHHLGRAVASQMGLDEPIPELAQLVAASPIDAAVHDAFGRANQVNSFNALSAEYMACDLAEYLDEQFAGEYLDAYTLREPKPTLPLYHLVGALDPLTDADIETRIDDGLPETLPEWIAADGLTHLKIKLNGDDLDWDVARVLAIEAVAAQAQADRGCNEWFYSTDFNEKCENVEYVLAFLAKVREGSGSAYERIQYIEQPTSRDLEAHPDVKMHEAAAIKPVVIDEALVDYDSLLLCREQGYSGVALKACKGQTDSLLLAAAAQKFDMFLCVQDLTCPGLSFLHSASLAARVPGVQAIEGNGRQYCPGPNRAWAKQFPGMFNITDGTVATSELAGIGLGF